MKKSALILLVAVAISTVSCVDNAVSPQVEAIRTQQVEWMKAKTAGQVAINDMQTASNAYDAASRAILLKQDELGYIKAVALNEEEKIKAAGRMATAKLELEASLKVLADAAANSGDAQAANYLREYTDASTTLAGQNALRLDYQNAIVRNQLVLNSPNKLKDFLAKTQLDIDSDNVKLVAENATFAIFTSAIAANSTTVLTTERFTVASENQVLLAKNINLTSDKNKLDIQRNPLLTEKALLENEKSTYNSPADDAKIAAVNVKIDAVVAKIAPLSTQINLLNASIAANTTIVNTNGLLISNLNTAITNLTGNNVAINFTTLVNTQASTKIKIDVLKASILTNQGLLLVNVETLAIKAAEAAIVVDTKRVATKNVEITAQEKIVAYWKALLDKIFTA